MVKFINLICTKELLNTTILLIFVVKLMTSE